MNRRPADRSRCESRSASACSMIASAAADWMVFTEAPGESGSNSRRWVCCGYSSNGPLDHRDASGWVVVIPDVARQPPMTQVNGINELMTQIHNNACPRLDETGQEVSCPI